MRSSFCIINIVTETDHILMKFIDILKCHFYPNPVCLSLKIDRLMQYLFLMVHIRNESDNPLRLMVFDLFF